MACEPQLQEPTEGLIWSQDMNVFKDVYSRCVNLIGQLANEDLRIGPRI